MGKATACTFVSSFSCKRAIFMIFLCLVSEWCQRPVSVAQKGCQPKPALSAGKVLSCTPSAANDRAAQCPSLEIAFCSTQKTKSFREFGKHVADRYIGVTECLVLRKIIWKELCHPKEATGSCRLLLFENETQRHAKTAKEGQNTRQQKQFWEPKNVSKACQRTCHEDHSVNFQHDNQILLVCCLISTDHSWLTSPCERKHLSLRSSSEWRNGRSRVTVHWGHPSQGSCFNFSEAGEMDSTSRCGQTIQNRLEWGQDRTPHNVVRDGVATRARAFLWCNMRCLEPPGSERSMGLLVMSDIPCQSGEHVTITVMSIFIILAKKWSALLKK